MRSAFWPLRTGLLITLICCLAPELSVRVASAENPSSAPCALATYHQFDFWIGDWDAFDVDSPNKVAHVRIDSILDGCVLREDYEGLDGHEGQSLTTYDNSRGVWHQTWVTNGGALLQIEGKLENNEMILSGRDQSGALVRGTWRPVNGEVREMAVKSNDDGKTWEPWFDIIFRRSESRSANDGTARGKEDERQIVAAIDAEYQSAVKRNDAATMDRILSDDFVLVTGSGHVYTKTDLLNEARNARRTYEHQEDSDKTVRVWGDTAIVTAKLWEKGSEGGKPFDHKLWFSDVYRRTASGWRYVFAQAACAGQSVP